MIIDQGLLVVKQENGASSPSFVKTCTILHMQPIAVQKECPHIVLAITLAVPGGATSFVYSYAFWLKQRGNRVTVVAGEGEWLFERCREADIPCVRAPYLQREIRPWLDLPAMFALTHMFRELQPDVVHLNSSKMGVIGSIAARAAHVPRVVYCIGGWAFLESIAPWKKLVYSIAERLTAPQKDVITCLHPDDKHAAEERHIRPRERIEIIPNGVDLLKLDHERLHRTDAREALGLRDDQFVFGTIANFYPAKRLAEYLREAKPILLAHPNARLAIIGDGPERAELEHVIATESLSSHVLLCGAREQAARYLSAFDVFVLPSSKEGMPFSLLEAMSARLPCIVTDVGAHAWMLKSTSAWVIPPANASALQTALEEAMTQPERLARAGDEARNAVERRFLQENMFLAHLDTICGPAYL